MDWIEATGVAKHAAAHGFAFAFAVLRARMYPSEAEAYPSEAHLLLRARCFVEAREADVTDAMDAWDETPCAPPATSRRARVRFVVRRAAACRAA